MKNLIVAGLLAAAFAILIPACNKADNAVDCNGICDRYKSCFDASYDSGACQDRCRDEADTEGYATQADECDACIDDKSCASATFECASKCAGIVP
jgi:hypothetical protein